MVGWDDRVVIDRSDLMSPAHEQNVSGHRYRLPEGAVVADGSLLRVWRLQAGIGRDNEAGIGRCRLGELVTGRSPRADRARNP